MDLMSLVAKITVDSSSFEKGISKAEKSGKSLSNVFSKVGSIAKKGMAVAGTAIGNAIVAVGKLATSSVKAYAQYEQLVGGVETLFGTNGKTLEEYAKAAGKSVDQVREKYNSLDRAQTTVLNNAKGAFKTAGLSANEYMETVTSFSAALTSSLKGNSEEAARVAHMAVVDMSDNANKMGTDMAAIQSAYQGFAKQNYTMLDNLKLGYGGTKTEMERLLADAQKLTGVKYDIQNLNDVYEAIHVIQTELGITGTTAKEAETTIQGSFTTMKAAWENLKIAMSSPDGNINQALDDFISSSKKFAKNVVPTFSKALKGMGTAIKELAPVISSELPTLVSDVLPDLVDAGVSLVGGMTKAIVDNADTIIDGFGSITKSIGDALQASDNPILKGAGKLISALGELIKDPNEQNLQKAWTALWEGISAVAETLWNGIKTLAGNVWKGIKGFWTENISKPVSAAWENVKTSVSEKWETIKSSASAAWESVKGFWTENIAQPVAQVWETVKTNVSERWDTIKSAASNAWDSIKGFWTENISGKASQVWETVKTNISNKWDAIKSAASNAWDSVKGFWTENISGTVSQVWENVKTKLSTTWDTIKTASNTAWQGVKKFWTENISGPASQVWRNVKTSVSSVWDTVKTAASNAWNSIKGYWTENISETVSSAWNAVKEGLSSSWENIKSSASTTWESIKGFWTENISSKVAEVWSNVLAALNPVLDPIKSAFEGVKSVVNSIWEGISAIFGFKSHDIDVNVNYHESGTPDWMKNGGGRTYAGGVGKTGGGVVIPTVDTVDAKGDWNVPYDNITALLHRGEMVLTKSQARKYRDGENERIDLSGLGETIVTAVREGIANATVNSYLDGKLVSDEISKILGSNLSARRFA